MARSDNEVTIEFLQVFANAWNRHDADALIEFMAPDCVYETSSGPNVCGPGIKDKNRFARDLPVSGNRFRMLSGSEPGISLSGTVGCRNGRSPAPIKNGQRVEVNGCDVFTFRDGEILIKNSYRKNRPPIN